MCSAKELNLKMVLQGGQSFRWLKCKSLKLADKGDLFLSTMGGGRWLVLMYSDNDSVFYYSKPIISMTQNNNIEKLNSRSGDCSIDVEESLKRYFNLHISIEQLYKEWQQACPIFARSTQQTSRWLGIRCLQIDPTENLFSFITSQNNNIPRITKLVRSLATTFGTAIDSALIEDLITDFQLESADIDEIKSDGMFLFPTVEQLAMRASEQQLRDLGFGYRAKYIHATTRQLIERSQQSPYVSVEEYLKSLRNEPYAECKSVLLSLTGIGPKVADCICLFSLDKHSTIPVDTHVKAIAERLYKHKSKLKSMTAQEYEAIQLIFTNRFGAFAGWAHSVLFIADLRYHDKKGKNADGDVEDANVQDDKENSGTQPTAKKVKRK